MERESMEREGKKEGKVLIINDNILLLLLLLLLLLPLLTLVGLDPSHSCAAPSDWNPAIEYRSLSLGTIYGLRNTMR